MTDIHIKWAGETIEELKRPLHEDTPVENKDKLYKAHEKLHIIKTETGEIIDTVRPGMLVKALKVPLEPGTTSQDLLNDERKTLGLYHILEIVSHQEKSAEQEDGESDHADLLVQEVKKASDCYKNYQSYGLHATDLVLFPQKFDLDVDKIICVEQVVRLDAPRKQMPPGYRMMVGANYRGLGDSRVVTHDNEFLIKEMTPGADVRQFYSFGHTSAKTKKPLDLVKVVVSPLPLMVLDEPIAPQEEFLQVQPAKEPTQQEQYLHELQDLVDWCLPLSVPLKPKGQVKPKEQVKVKPTDEPKLIQQQHAGEKRKKMCEAEVEAIKKELADATAQANEAEELYLTLKKQRKAAKAAIAKQEARVNKAKAALAQERN